MTTIQSTALVSVEHLNKVYESKERRVETIGDLSFFVSNSRPGLIFGSIVLGIANARGDVA